MTIVRVGANSKFSEGWELAFGKSTAAKSGPNGKTKAKPAKSAKKKASPKKAARAKGKKK